MIEGELGNLDVVVGPWQPAGGSGALAPRERQPRREAGTQSHGPLREGRLPGCRTGCWGLAPAGERKIVRRSVDLYDIPDGLVAISWPALCGSRCPKRSRRNVLLGLRTGTEG